MAPRRHRPHRKTTNDGRREVVFFINAQPVSAGVRETSGGNSIPPEAIDATTLRIGTLPGTHPGGTTLDGDIDELHIFRAALGKEEILRLMERDQWF